MRSRPEVRLVFPPVAPSNEIPELGMPQVAGALRDAGVAHAQHDLNVELLYDFLREGSWVRRMDRATGGSGPTSPGGEARRLALPARTPDEVEALRLWAERCVATLALSPRPYRLPEMRAAVLAGHPVYEPFFEERLFRRVEPPELALGLSLMSSEQLLPGLLLARMAKERWPGCFVVVGGPWVRAARNLLGPLLDGLPWVDGAVPTRGEGAVVALVRALREGAGVGSVPDLVFRGPRRVERGREEPVAPLAEAATPSFDGLDLDAYPARLLPVQTTSRCPWGRCLFCHHDDHRGPLTHRDAARVVDDIESLHRRHGVPGFFLADCATPVELMVGIAGEVCRRGLPVGWSALARADARLTPAACGELRRGGCRALLVGLETADERELVRLRKGVSPALVAETARACAEAGIAVYLFVLDYPGQGRDALERTLRFVVDLAPWVEDFIVSRFQLSELSRLEEAERAFGLRRRVARDPWLDVFDLPFDAPGLGPRATHDALVRRYARELFEARGGGPRRGPFLVGA